MSYLRLNYIGKSSLRLVIKENEKKEQAYITKYQYQSKIGQKPSSTPPPSMPPPIKKETWVAGKQEGQAGSPSSYRQLGQVR
jgi:hypothetical protein